jgi:hypothetical protein
MAWFIAGQKIFALRHSGELSYCLVFSQMPTHQALAETDEKVVSLVVRRFMVTLQLVCMLKKSSKLTAS